MVQAKVSFFVNKLVILIRLAVIYISVSGNTKVQVITIEFKSLLLFYIKVDIN